MGIGKHYFSTHALRRLRERWEVARVMPKRELLEQLASSLQSATEHQQCVRTPGGLYAPFSLGGIGGFMVVKEDCVVTIVPKEWAPEVSELLEERKKEHG